MLGHAKLRGRVLQRQDEGCWPVRCRRGRYIMKQHWTLHLMCAGGENESRHSDALPRTSLCLCAHQAQQRPAVM